ncbi:hypothetical protein FOL47_007274 [Perkinsus chesapeaki]|uniref:L-dopachrome isomerase n=1 Tax=Perkinsus chesapeaki TaxID=330153 RepID=A0A7J6LM27_PERCH|nr:hypothetical protein FOL47_007274 [Perkinsus chesapeaki]
MPCVTVTTDVKSIVSDPARAGRVMADAVSKALGKPKQYITVKIVPAAGVYVGGDEAGGVSVEIYSIGGGLKGTLCDGVYDTLEKEYGIKSDKAVVRFQNLNPAEYAMNGNTFA